MLSLFIANVSGSGFWVETDPSFSIGATYQNPAFFRGETNDFCYPIRLPNNSIIKNLFFLIHEPKTNYGKANSIFNQQLFKAYVYDEGKPVVTGRVELTEITEQYIEISIKQNFGLINSVGDTLLKDFLADKLDIINVQTLPQVFVFDVTAAFSTNLNIYIGDTLYTEVWDTDLNTTLANLAATIDGTASWIGGSYTVSASTSGNRITFTANWNGVSYDTNGERLLFRCLPSPAPTYAFSFVPSLSSTSAQTLYSQWKNEMIAKEDIFWPNAAYCYFPVAFYEGGIKDATNPSIEYDPFFFNFFNDPTAEWLIPHRDSSIYYWTLQSAVSPWLFVMHVFQKICTAAGITNVIADNNYNAFQEVLAQMCMLNNVATERTDLIILELLTLNQIHESQIDEYLNLVDKLPQEATVKEFVNAFLTVCNAQLFVNSLTGTATLLPLEENLTNADYIDWTDKLASLPRITKPRAKNYQLTYTYDSSDEFTTDITKSLAGYTIVNVALYADLVAIIPARKTLYYVVEQRLFYRPIFDLTTPGTIVYAQYSDDLADFFTPDSGLNFPPLNPELETLTIGADIVRQSTGSAPIWPITKTKITSVWIAPTDVEAAEYVTNIGIRFMMYRGMIDDFPLGNYQNYDAAGTRIADVSLSLQGDDGLYNRFYKSWLAFLQKSRELEVQLNLTHTDIAMLDMSKKIMIENELYFIKQMEVQFPLKEPAKVLLVKIEK